MLSLLRKQDRYGYEVSDYLSKHIDIADGTVYPLLRKLKADGLVTTYLQEESGGPPRKYYKLTSWARTYITWIGRSICGSPRPSVSF